MNELREKIQGALADAQIEPVIKSPVMGGWVETNNMSRTTDAILDAVIAALPEVKPVPAYKEAIKWSQGYREAVLETKDILQAAKENK